MTQHQEANSADPAEICAPFGLCDECGIAAVDTDATGADGRSVCDDCRDAEEHDTPDESDDYIADDRDGYSVTHDERNIGTFKTLRRAEACLYLARARDNYWPNIWRVNERGNTTLCVFDSHVLRATDIGYV